eukprot:GHVP01028939.1.p1 GENE.GHVP01028939.1~~GHVP01028939.1.p1  ORF type:complete len:1092 (+),score=163.12 GHVP01028939.1:24-3299(+)
MPHEGSLFSRLFPGKRSIKNTNNNIPYSESPNKVAPTSSTDPAADSNSAECGKFPQITHLDYFEASPVVESVGIEGNAEVFDFDPLLQIAVTYCPIKKTATLFSVEGEIKLPSVNTEFDQIGQVQDLVFIPGTGVFVSLEKHKDRGSAIRIWDFGQIFRNVKRPLKEFTPEIPVFLDEEICFITRGHNQKIHKKKSKDTFPANWAQSVKKDVITNDEPHVSCDVGFGPSGSPESDDNWIFFVGTEEGSLFLFDAFNNKFESISLNLSAVVKSIGVKRLLPPAISQCKLKSLPAGPLVKVIQRPQSSSSLYLAYQNGVVVAWDFAKNVPQKIYLLSLPGKCPIDIIEKDLHEETKPADHWNSHFTFCVPSDMKKSSVVIKNIEFHAFGLSFVVATEVLGTNNTVEDIRLYVFSISRGFASACVSLMYGLGNFLPKNLSILKSRVPMLHWQDETPTPSFVQSIRTTPNPSQPFLFMRHNIFIQLSLYCREREYTGVWRFCGVRWTDALPVVEPSWASRGCTKFVRVVRPSKFCTSSESSSFGGLWVSSTITKDSSDAASNIISAGLKLSYYLMSGTFLVALVKNPTSFLGACIHIDRNQLRTLRKSFELWESSGSTEQFSKSITPKLGESDEKSNEDLGMIALMSFCKPIPFEISLGCCQYADVVSLDHIPSRSLNHTLFFHDGAKGNRVNSLSQKILRRVLLKRNGGEKLELSDLPVIFEKKHFMTYDELEATADALYTIRKKCIIRNWLWWLSGHPETGYLDLIPNVPPPTQQSFVMENRKARFSPLGRAVFKKRNAREVESAPAEENSSSANHQDNAQNRIIYSGNREWILLDESRDYGDLLRPCVSKWGNEGPIGYVVGSMQGLLATGHKKGRIKIWSAFSSGLVLLHSLSCFHLRETDVGDSLTPIYTDISQVIGSIDARPTQKQDEPDPTGSLYDIKSVRLFVGSFSCDRILAAGTTGGHTVVFRWSVNAEPPILYRDLSNADNNGVLQPFGFQVIINHHEHLSWPVNALEHYALQKDPKRHFILSADSVGLVCVAECSSIKHPSWRSCIGIGNPLKSVSKLYAVDCPVDFSFGKYDDFCPGIKISN